MSYKIDLMRKTVNLEKVWIHIECPNCHKSFSIQLKKPNFQKKCHRCDRATFHIDVTTLHGSVIDVTVMAQIGFSLYSEISPDSHEIEGL